MEKLLLDIYSYFSKKRLAFYIVFAASFLFIGYFALQVKFEEDISKIIPKDKRIEKLNEIFQNSKFIDKLVIMVSLKDTTAQKPDSLVTYADAFGATVQQKLAPYIKKVNFKVDDDIALQLFGTISERLPIYLNRKDYLTIDTLITPAKVKETLQSDIKILTSPAGIALKKVIVNDPVGLSFIGLKKLQQLQYDKNFELYDDYVITRDHKTLLLFITPVYPPNNTGKNAVFLKGLDSVFTSLNDGSFKGINASYFGAVAGFAGNAAQLRQDTNLTLTITVVVLVLFLGLYFRNKSAPFIILIPVLFGALFSLTIIYFVKGSLSVIALGTGSVVLGIAINYSLHVFNHYRHTKSVEQVIKDLMLPLTIGSFTTIGGFLCLEFVQSEMLKDLGLFAAFSLIGASFCSLVFLPQFITTKKEQKHHQIIQFSWIDKLASYNPEYNKFIVTGIVLLTIVFTYTANYVKFEFDLTGMNYMSPKIKQAETKLNRINKFSLQSVYLVTEGKTLDEALINNEKLSDEIETLKQKNIVIKYSGVSSLIISDSLQKERIERWNNYWTPEKKQQLLATLQQQGAAMSFKPSAFDKFETLLNKQYDIGGKQNLAEIRKSFLDDFINEKPGHSTVVTLVQTSPQNKQAVYDAFKDNPNVTVVDKQYLTNKLVVIINSDFTKIAVMSSLLVLIVLWLTYGRIELTLVSFIPMFISWIWILGIMGICGIGFNIVNIIISALIFGLGDDYSLYIMDGLLQEYETGKKVLSSYKTSIFLSAITTIVGLGVLVFAKHPALKSIAFISIIGISCVVLMSQILIPFLFNILVKNRVEKKRFPWTFSGFVVSIFAFCYFVTGCIILTILGFLFKLNPFNKEKGKLVYHFILSKFTWSMMYIMVNVKKEIINPQYADFSKPAVIISNHQSFLDILSMVMLHPKLILLTNNWVWNSPVFGAVARMADFYPVAQGAENSLALLADRVKHGYSVVVFPEGTRSVEGDIKRFHKGAFYLAEQLNIDILPIVIHGTGYTMTKGDFLLKNGTISIKYLPRIKQDDTRFGTGFAERTKLISRYFKAEYAQLSIDTEQPAYYKEQLIYNYLYKGPLLEWRLKLKLRRERNYQLFHDLLPREGKMLDVGCGYGFSTYLLHFAAKDRQFIGIDRNEDKIEAAGNCFSKDSEINFIFADALEFAFETYDAIILADVLRNMQLADQQALIEKCMRSLNPGATIIIKINNGSSLPVKSIAATNNMECVAIEQNIYPGNQVFIIKQ
ncbi:trifunctional MMPL family transporter/lysophospholipid acyltransferase/class I SAM-dependent methyltransferase [Mucilaginibacter sp. dw_454]|uniref:trifunctional MMPL family transporter/lysophospholipid acyltransferase/class I SAM-dependent methyltransferase n=1 Tax=Mucilaginibacter sp. dw_454 TaxID=2720079 RepID=UPI001BD3C093|nr:trifunctional MMPL family transporter/lysophospholipid acyltransferase/class I SAM-dependent methyltransferase [Mucilaginibacter sp. dw_454]